MFLKALSVKGFKSFADPATLELEPGVTVVVGPNGSGKSNVVDAIAWVLGAQAPTSVRSQKMDDVIFAGTAKKAALGRAEVTLTIDNASGTLPIEFNEVNITRILFRSGDSEYAINGVACRLLDIQELLSDSGVGRQQHIIVSQGQIDSVLNARPEDRRLIIEEAAGVLKYRKRKERSERRLAATEDNLVRLQDLVREVSRQLKPLERQADAARRHGDLLEELTALRFFLSGRELRSLRGNLEGCHRQRSELAKRENDLLAALADLDAKILDGEAELAALGGSDVSEILSKARSLGERLSGQQKVVVERHRRLEGELQASVDQEVVAGLESESSRLAEELEASLSERSLVEPDIVELVESETSLAQATADFEERWGEGLGPAPVQAAEARAQIAALKSAADRDNQENSRVVSQLEALVGRSGRLEVDRSEADATKERLELEIPVLNASLAETAKLLSEAESGLVKARDSSREAAEESSRWRARADALTQALDAARSAAGVDALSGTAGVLGTLLDVISIQPGWEPAVEAAVGEALNAVVVDSSEHGQAALSALDNADIAGAVLALGAKANVVGQQTVASVGVGSSVRERVRALRTDVEPLLDLLVGQAIVVDASWAEALDAALAHPDRVIVTRNGDRFGPTGWRVGRSASGATGAALEEAKVEAENAVQAAGAAQQALKEAEASQSSLRAQHRSMEAELSKAENSVRGAIETVQRSSSLLAEVEGDRERLAVQHSEIGARRAAETAELEALQHQLPGLEADEAAHYEQAQAMADERSRLDDRARSLASSRTELEVRAAGLDERIELLGTRRAEVEERLARLVQERDAARVRREDLEAALEALSQLGEELIVKREDLQGWVDSLAMAVEEQSEAAGRVSSQLSQRRQQRKNHETELVEVRERGAKLDLSEAENKVRLETLTEAIRGDLDVEPDQVLNAECPEVPQGSSPEARARELDRDLKKLGPINPLALEEFSELKERHDFLVTQLDDVKSTKRDLRKLIREVDEQIVAVFSAAYADVATNFTDLFATLFPGGRGDVKLTGGEDLLNCGVEIEAKPSGKNVKKLSLLSGGERSLTALGFLFAVFRSRPSPFYVMDEVEAALDDVNLDRFLALIDEFRKEAQLVIVSHQKRTMEAADVLYGVSVKPGGSSKVVSERMTAETAAKLSGSPPA